MEKLVLTGTVCFCVGLTVGLILGAVVMALAVAAKKYKPKTKEIDDCWGCFGAATFGNLSMVSIFGAMEKWAVVSLIFVLISVLQNQRTAETMNLPASQ